MTKWKSVFLKDILSERGYIRGPFGSALKRGEMKEQGFPVYEQQHAINGIRSFRYFIDDVKFKELERFKVEENDLIVSCSGTVGEVSLIKEADPKGIISQALLILRPYQSLVLPKFLYYYFVSSNGKNSLISRSSGSVQVNIAKREIIQGIGIPLPAIPIQEKIVTILSSIDDKIELNLKMNETIEQMAKTLYKHWFIDFGPFKAEEFVESELGMIPKGWEVKKLSEVVNTKYGYTESATAEEIGPHFLRITDIQNSFISWNKVPYCTIDEKNFEKYQLHKGDIVIARTGNSTGAVGYVNSTVNAVFASFLVRLQAKNDDLSSHYLYLLTTSHEYQSYIERAGIGSARKGANAQLMTNYHIALPPKDVMDSFHTKVDNLFELIEKNTWENIELKATQDYLLPRLLSGEINLETSEKHIQEVL
mgnify:CR=1 FL=1